MNPFDMRACWTRNGPTPLRLTVSSIICDVTFSMLWLSLSLLPSPPALWITTSMVSTFAAFNPSVIFSLQSSVVTSMPSRTVTRLPSAASMELIRSTPVADEVFLRQVAITWFDVPVVLVPTSCFTNSRPIPLLAPVIRYVVVDMVVWFALSSNSAMLLCLLLVLRREIRSISFVGILGIARPLWLQKRTKRVKSITHHCIKTHCNIVCLFY
mmetsp:Transcript_7299/g.15000  ORF Transcript_7299/g.15000 Transcript_7299/m.15000 type:complete len:212 (-) Transcript_7299:77-712(-)